MPLLDAAIGVGSLAAFFVGGWLFLNSSLLKGNEDAELSVQVRFCFSAERAQAADASPLPSDDAARSKTTTIHARPKTHKTKRKTH